MKRKIGISLLILLVVIVGLLLFISLNLGKTIEVAVETALPGLTGADINIDKVVVRPLAGKVQVKGLVLGNPEGYKSKHAIAFGEFRVNMEIKSLMSDKIHIQEIFLQKPQIIYEMGLGNSNIGTILANLNEAAARPAAEEEVKPGEPEPAKPEKRLVIDHFRIESPMVTIASKLTQGVGAPIPLPTIDVKDIGKDNPDGATPAQVCAKVLGSIATSISRTVQDSTAAVGKEVTKALGDITETGGAAANELVGTAGKAAGEAAKAAGAAVDGLVKGVFGGKKKEQDNAKE